MSGSDSDRLDSSRNWLDDVSQWEMNSSESEFSSDEEGGSKVRGKRKEYAREHLRRMSRQRTRAPKSLLELQGMQDTDIIKVGTQTESRDGMFLRACEISEKHKKQVKYQKCTAEAMVVTCIEKSCEFLLQASFKSREEVWECKKIQSHTCLENQSQGGKNGKQKRMTAYSADQLLPGNDKRQTDAQVRYA